ncbi:MAG: hypothetical protein KDE35_13295 [Geminicoccaceae bacterium]|nr:hypothetical protein [Geminicoccaceae bacterium]
MSMVRMSLLDDATRLLADLVERNRAGAAVDARAFLDALGPDGVPKRRRPLGLWMPASLHAHGFPLAAWPGDPGAPPALRGLEAYRARMADRVRYEGPVWPLRLQA